MNITRECVECGQVFEVIKQRGRMPLTCGDACRKDRIRRQVRENLRKRYQWDEGYRARANAPRDTCAKCGKPIMSGRGSRPKGERCCRKCGWAKPKPVNLYKMVCSFCGRKTNKRRSKYGYRSCEFCAVAREAERYRDKKRARRAIKTLRDIEKYTTSEIAARDNYRCGICKLPVQMDLSGMHDYGPTIDHVIALINGGHDIRDNVQLAHRVCNTRKGARGTA